YLTVQPGLVLKEIQVAPRTPQPVMHPLGAGTAGWTRQSASLTTDLEVDAALGGIQRNVLHHPWQLQTQCAGEQRFHSNVHYCYCSCVDQISTRAAFWRAPLSGIKYDGFHTKR